ncbi:MAG: hypothetical protein OMM_02815 [Candidatus Magnetoglobus multicellularis str. Araruama]|uniref:Uncharacterized protein TP-0789 domain-containing protein n=1 Tax=Candidatus Magnetoglobus multicellularis str. Araruama TaxID=890399 RepID=A0A1V1P873_9BACT|nr:MAG: hypothetical protein OMM_02815 [Candidatus Magnetoglobus multicellularis str. Araruama]
MLPHSPRSRLGNACCDTCRTFKRKAHMSIGRMIPGRVTMFYKHIIMIIFASVYLIQTAMASHPTALQIMEKVDARNDGASLTCDMEMQLIDHRDNIRTRRIRLYSKDYGKDVYAIQFFMSPSDVKNTAFLSYDYDGSKDDDQWLYLPALRKTKRIAVDDKTSSYMGSDFSYADMTKIELENYHFKLLEERTVRKKKYGLSSQRPKLMIL